MVWKDCFGKELKKGEDVIFAIIGDWNQPELHSAIVIDMDNSCCHVTFNSWEGDEERVHDIKIYIYEYEDGIIKCLYKLYK